LRGNAFGWIALTGECFEEGPVRNDVLFKVDQVRSVEHGQRGMSQVAADTALVKTLDFTDLR